MHHQQHRHHTPPSYIPKAPNILGKRTAFQGHLTSPHLISYHPFRRRGQVKAGQGRHRPTACSKQQRTTASHTHICLVGFTREKSSCSAATTANTKGETSEKLLGSTTRLASDSLLTRKRGGKTLILQTFCVTPPLCNPSRTLSSLRSYTKRNGV